MRSAEILSKPSSTSAAARSSHDVGSLSRFNIVRFTAAVNNRN